MVSCFVVSTRVPARYADVLQDFRRDYASMHICIWRCQNIQYFVTALFSGQHYFFGPKVSSKTNFRYTLQPHPIRFFSSDFLLPARNFGEQSWATSSWGPLYSLNFITYSNVSTEVACFTGDNLETTKRQPRDKRETAGRLPRGHFGRVLEPVEELGTAPVDNWSVAKARRVLDSLKVDLPACFTHLGEKMGAEMHVLSLWLSTPTVDQRHLCEQTWT